VIASRFASAKGDGKSRRPYAASMYLNWYGWNPLALPSTARKLANCRGLIVSRMSICPTAVLEDLGDPARGRQRPAAVPGF
jgi:hypothetical protein